MKTKIILSLALLAMLAACSKNDDNVPDDPKGKIDITQSIEFKVNVKDFNAEKDVAGSRAAQKPDTISKKTVDLGNNLLAEVTVQRDTAQTQAPTTRVLADDTYTMLVFQGSGISYTLKARVTGTLKDGKFRPGKGVRLDPGNYTFVLHNNCMEYVTTVFGTPGLKFTRADADKALLGQTPYTVTATPDPQYVDFEMSHVGNRMRIKLTGWMPIQASTTASIQDYNYGVLPENSTIELPYSGDVGWDGHLQNIDLPLTFPGSTTLNADGTYTTTSNEYLYFVPGTRMEGLKLKFTGGQIYKTKMKDVTVQLISLVDPATHVAHAMGINESYLVNINLKYNFLYLMSDGTTDFLNSTQYTALRADDGKTKIYRDKAGNLLTTPKVPIAVVLSQSKGMAIALKDAGGEGTVHEFTTNINYRSTQVNTDMKMTWSDLLTMENGYDETWDGSYSAASVTGEKIKGKNPDFPAFKIVADYRPTLPTGVNLTNGMENKKWYLPALGEWKYVLSALGFADMSQQPTGYNYYDWYGNLANVAFTQVDGEPLADNREKNYWTSSELQYTYAGLFIPGQWGNPLTWAASYSYDKGYRYCARAFIRYK